MKDPHLFGDLNEWDLTVTYCDLDSVELDIAEDIAYIVENAVDMDIDALKNMILYEEFNTYLKDKKPKDSLKVTPWKNYYDKLPEKYAEFKDRVCFERFDGRANYKCIEPAEFLIFIRSIFGKFGDFYEKYR